MKSHEQQNEGGVRYSSKLMSALNKFAGGLSTDVHNPLLRKYGRAYDYLISADAFRYKEDIDAALDQYRHALAIREDFTEAHIGVGKCLRRKGDSMGAIRYFKLALKGNPFNKEVHLDLGKCYNECGYIDKAIQHYERAIKLAPDYLEAKFGLALIVELGGDLAYATTLYHDIIEQDPEFLPAYNNLGSIYLRQGVFARAEQVFRSLVRRAPDFGRGYLGLALTLDKSNNMADALDAYNKVLEIKSSTRNVDYVKRRIIALNKALGRAKTRRNTTLVRVK